MRSRRIAFIVVIVLVIFGWKISRYFSKANVDWSELLSALPGKVEIPQAPFKESLDNPFALEDQSGATQSVGWYGAWSTELSTRAVVAESTADIVTAVKFARKHNIKVVIKSTGHDYLGRSNAPDSLLIWTHKMRDVKVVDAFAPVGCTQETQALPAVSVGAGTRWLDAYREVNKHGRYVQGGGCTSVGAAGGFLQGGGFGSWSKKFGIAAASLLEAEVVTADGKVLIANACQNTDLFWALKGGGGGTFGVVTRATLMTHQLPTHFGFVSGTIKAKSDGAFRALLERFITLYNASLANEHWGEKIVVKGDNTLEIQLSSQGLSTEEEKTIFKHFSDEISFFAVSGETMWNLDFIKAKYPNVIRIDDRPNMQTQYWWIGDGNQVSAYWHAYQSRWLAQKMFQSSLAPTLAQAFFFMRRAIGLSRFISIKVKRVHLLMHWREANEHRSTRTFLKLQP